MLAVALATAAQSQTPTSDQAPTPAATELISPAPIASSNSGAPPASEQATPRDSTALQTPIASPSDVASANVPAASAARADAANMANGAPADVAHANVDQTEVPPADITKGNGAQANATQANAVQANVEKADVVQATAYLKTAAADFTNCRRASACKTYFDAFGVAIPFADGSIVPFSHVQRLSATSRECVKKAKALEEEGDRSLAVQWAMAARIENRTIRDWLGSHPDAVLEALRQVTVL